MDDRTARLVAIAALGLLLFNYPLLSIVDRSVRVLGVPVLWAYLFTAWALVIGLMALVMRPPR